MLCFYRCLSLEGHAWQGDVGCVWQGNICGRGAMHGGSVCMAGDMGDRNTSIAGGHMWQGVHSSEAYMEDGGMHGRGRIWKGVGIAGGMPGGMCHRWACLTGGCVWQGDINGRGHAWLGVHVWQWSAWQGHL